MKKQILINVAISLTIIFCVYICYHHLNNLITIFKVYDAGDIEEITISTILPNIFCILFSVIILIFSICFLVYINKNDITSISQSFSESRQKKAEEKKQQQIQALEEKLNQLKKDD